MDVLQKGDSGEIVKQLQNALITLGYSVGPTGADGKFGTNTEKALKKYQADHDEPVTGVLDSDTWADIEIDLDIKQKETAAQATTVTVVPASKTYSTVMIGGASGDENHQAKGGEAGNQTGKELKIQKWYNGKWNVVLRPKDATLAENLAIQCEGACGNMKIGYDQGERNTILAAAEKAGWILANINTPCECDCSSLMATCCICCGLPEKYYYVKRNLSTTKTIESACKQTKAFDILTDSKYLTQKDYLKRGDILVAAGSHTCMVLQDGSKVEKQATTTKTTLVDKLKSLFSSNSSSKSNGYIGKVTGGSVYVRTGPGKEYKYASVAHRGDKFLIVEEKNGWGRIENAQPRWISLKYISKEESK